MGSAASTRRWTAQDLREAIARAADWLVDRQEEPGCWTDFRIGPRLIADEWATAYVGQCLQTVRAHSPRISGALVRARSFLLAREDPGGGWGYSAQVASDGDSTSLALIFLRGEGLGGGFERTRQWLIGNQMPDGGVCTYRYDSHPAPLRFRMRGWCTSQPSITGAALVALGPEAPGHVVGKAVAFLEGRFREAGYWQDYWWLEPYYPTCWAVQALLQRGLGAAQAGRVRRWLVESQQESGAWGRDGGRAFATALAVKTLVLLAEAGSADTQAAIEAGVSWLLERAEPDGGYRPSAEMNFPESYVVDFPDGDPLRLGELVTIVTDHRGFFTTATVADALGRVYDQAVP